MRTVFIVDPGGIFLKQTVIAFGGCLLKQNDRFWIVEMIFLALSASELVIADGIQGGIDWKSKRIEGAVMMINQIFFNLL